MAIYTIGAPDGRKIKIEAPDEATAIRGAQEWTAANPIKQPGDFGTGSPVVDELRANASARAQKWGSAAPAPLQNNLATSTAATISGIVNGIPVIGPLAQNASDNLMGIGAQLTGGDYGQTVEGLRTRREQIAQAAPIASAAGNVAGAIGSLGGLGAIPAGAEALGLTGANIGARMLNSGLSGAGIAMLDEAARGGDSADMLAQGAIGAGIGAAVPGLGAGIKAVARPFLRPISETVSGLTRPFQQAQKSVAGAYERDVANRAAPVISQADEAAARMNGQPLLNVDRGGETTRALMRSAANQNPEARAIVEKTAEDRFRTQSTRATDFFRRIMGGNVDDLARKSQIKAQSGIVNEAAYKRAYSDPKAAAIWTPEIRQLMQSDSFRAAINAAETMGTDVAAAQGVKAVRNPFVFGQDGSVTLRKAADGSVALPSLQFWNQVKRALDSKIGLAQRSGDNTTASNLMAIKRTLVGALDSAVPAYKDARGVAASFFDAEDAVDAGRKAFAAPKQIDESLAALKEMSAAEKDDFALGMVSQLMDDVRAGNNRANLTRMFDVPARKELMEAALGPAKARQFEAFVRVEDVMDKMRGALGNSTTARQLMELGIMGGLGAGAGGLNLAAGGNMNSAAATAMLVAAGRAGFRNLRVKANDQVMQKVAELLASGNKADLDKVMANAMLSKQHMEALGAIQKGIGITARGVAMTALN